MPKVHTMSIAPDVMDVLKRSTIGSATLKLPEQLDRALYQKVAKVIELAGGKWNRSAKCHTFIGDPREILGIALESGKIEDAKKTYQAFYTPKALADKMVRAANLQPYHTILEPSAGHGALIQGVFDFHFDLPQRLQLTTAVELNPKEVAYLRQQYPTLKQVIEGDFLEMTCEKLGGQFDRVILNPPFTNDQDIAHVEHALSMLKPGGTLVAIMSPGFTMGGRRARKQFQDLVTAHRWHVEELDEGTFAESGTNVRTVMVTITLPKG